jgi:uncharacterized cupin superfamily protein
MFAGAASAQYKWVDRDGRVQYGDAPPAGVNAAPMRRAPAPLPQAEPADKKDDAKDAKDAKKGPQTAAEQDAAFRKRQQEAEKDREKQAKADSATAVKRENCARAQEYVRTLETGRVAGTDATGERYFLDDNQLAQQSARARQDVRDWCN